MGQGPIVTFPVLPMHRTPSPCVRGEGGVRGRHRQTQSCGKAQNRGSAPSPSLASLARPLPARGERCTCKSVLAMRSAPESSSRDENFSALRTDLRQRTPAVDTGILTICASSDECKNGRKARKRNADRRVTNDRTLRGAARADRRALASRRPTTALCHWDYSSQGSTWARLRDTPYGVALPAMHLARRS